MTQSQSREAARKFANKWKNTGNEDEHGRSYWIELLQQIFGIEDATDRLNFEKKVKVDGNTKRIDVYIPETHVIIEQKSLGKSLDKKLVNSGDAELTPYEQAKRYNDNLPYEERARWIVTSNFSDIWIYDMSKSEPSKDENIEKIHLTELPDKYVKLDFLFRKDVKAISNEVQVSIKAGDIVGLIYDALFEQYHIPDTKNATDEQLKERENKLKSLNALCVRLVFCLYAEDADIFGRKKMFHDYLSPIAAKDMRKALIELFKILDTPIDKREEFLEDELAQFPYVNGGLFADEDIIIPQFTDRIKELILHDASDDFNWHDISPTIFGAVFESTLNPETRRAGGMHYTSIENIHKVIDPLFLDDLKAEWEDIKNIKTPKIKSDKIKKLQEKISKLCFLDPACGSGNFLTETYISLRKLENEMLRDMSHEQITLEQSNLVKVSIEQFYGIEVNDFAVTVAKTALWIAESQMLEETKSIVWTNIDFLPLKTNAYIVEGNALRINWEDVVPKDKLNYIMGNPPFVGGMYMSEVQKDEIKGLFDGVTGAGEFDFVTGWYKKAAIYIEDKNIKCAFVSTNSICQGSSVITFWKHLINEYHIAIDFAYTTFVWNSEASIQAKVHCVIIGFSKNNIKKEKRLYQEDGSYKKCKQISPYLTDTDIIFVESRSTPLCNVPKMRFGSMPRDGGGYILNEKEREQLIKLEPLSKKWIRPYMGAVEFLNNKKRWCLWLLDALPNEIKQCPTVMKRIEYVRCFRASSKAAGTRKFAETPTVFCQIAQPSTDYIVVPKTSSGRRRYIPIGFVDKKVIASDLVFLIPNAGLYEFAVLMSNVHNSWMRLVAGRLKSDYRYSKDIVYNNFPWCEPTPEQKKKIEATAQGILDARNIYPDSSLADLYDPLTMPPELRKAHTANDRAVMAAYGFDTSMSEEDCVAQLMKLYQKLSSV